MKQEQRLYRDLAWVWPIISPPEDYVLECEHLLRILHASCGGTCYQALHFGCGGGHHDYTLAKEIALTGVDLNPAMIEHARRLNPGVDYHVGDMRTVSMNRLYDAVLLLDGNPYLTSLDDLQQTFQVAWNHLRPGGIILTVVEWIREEFIQNQTLLSSRTQGTTDITMIENLYDPDPDDTTMECTFVYLIRQQGELTTETDRHTLGLFRTDQWLQQMELAGFDIDVIDSSQLSGDLYNLLIPIGRKPA